jgi:threonine/homoserine/homoserine lactone efflux protein
VDLTAAALAPFALASLIVELTPGPNMGYLALVAATEGRARGLAAVAGVALGLLVLGSAASVGVAALFAAAPWVDPLVRVAGIAWLLWLAWLAWRGTTERDEGGKGGASARAHFLRGLIGNLLNAKTVLFFAVVVPSFLPPGASPTTADRLVLAGVYAAVATAVHAGIVVAAGSVHRLVSTPARLRRALRMQALGLVAVAVWLALA